MRVAWKLRVLTLLAILFCPNLTRAQAEWAMKVESVKPNYMVGEPVEIGISFTNKSLKTIHLDQRSLHDGIMTHGVLTNERGEHIRCHIMDVSLFSPQETLFVSGQEDYHLVSLNYFYGEHIFSSSAQSELPLGSYRLKIAFHPAQGGLYLDSINFQVASPTGEEAEIYERFKQLLIRKQQERDSRTLAMAQEFQTLAESHPASVYAPSILSEAEAFYRILLDDGATADDVAAKIVENYPGSSGAEGHMRALLRNAPSKAERLALLKRIRAKMPKNTPMRKVIEQRLRKENAR